MKTSRATQSFPLLPTILFLVQQPAVAQKHPPGKPFDIASGTYAGEIVRGPSTITAVDLNTIRYNYQFGSVVTYKAAPDLWTNLGALGKQNIPAPAPAVPAPVPKAPASPAPPPQQRSTVGLTPAQIKAANTEQAKKEQAFQTVSVILTKGDVLTRNQKAIHDELTPRIERSRQPIDDLRAEAMRLSVLQNIANAALALTAQAGASLNVYLTSTRDDSESLAAATATELQPNSVFVSGIGATWPDLPTVVSLQNDVVLNAKDLADANLELAAYSPAELSKLKASEIALSNLEGELATAYAAYVTAYKPSPGAPEVVSETEGMSVIKEGSA